MVIAAATAHFAFLDNSDFSLVITIERSEDGGLGVYPHEKDHHP